MILGFRVSTMLSCRRKLPGRRRTVCQISSLCCASLILLLQLLRSRSHRFSLDRRRARPIVVISVRLSCENVVLSLIWRCAAFNMIGVIHVVERDDQNIVTIEFHDRGSRSGSHFNDSLKFTLGALGMFPPSIASEMHSYDAQVNWERSLRVLRPRKRRQSSFTNLTIPGLQFKNGSTRSPFPRMSSPSLSVEWTSLPHPIRSELELEPSSSRPTKDSCDFCLGVDYRNTFGIWEKRSLVWRRGRIGL